MKKQALMLAASLAGFAVLGTTASSQSPERGEAFVLEMLGQYGWEVSCSLNQDDGDQIATRERGRGLHDNGRFAVSDVTGGLCSYSVPDGGELRLTLHVEHTGFDCPFGTSADGFCRAYLQPGDRGSFPIRRSGPAPAYGY